MNPLFVAIMLGAVQGLTEFLPVSSTAHLAVLPAVFGFSHPLLESQTFDAVLHLGTLAALVIVFRRDIVRMLTGAARLATPGGSRSPDGRLAIQVIVATLPALAAGYLLEDTVSARFRSTESVAGFLALGAVILWAAESARRPGTRAARALGTGEALAIGCAQALAVLPGMSRSGMTIAAALALGLSRGEAARFAFLLSVPVIAAAGIWESRHLGSLAPGEPALLAVGVAMAAVTGATAIRWFMRVLPRIGVLPFVVYRFLLSLVLLAR